MRNQSTPAATRPYPVLHYALEFRVPIPNRGLSCPRFELRRPPALIKNERQPSGWPRGVNNAGVFAAGDET